MHTLKNMSTISLIKCPYFPIFFPKIKSINVKGIHMVYNVTENKRFSFLDCGEELVVTRQLNKRNIINIELASVFFSTPLCAQSK